MTRSQLGTAEPPPVADTRRRIRSTTGLAAAAATIAAALFGVVFAQPDTPPAAAETAPEPAPEPASTPTLEPAPVAGFAPRLSSGSSAPTRQHHHIRQAPQAPQAPPRPPVHVRAPAVVTSGAS